MMTEDEQRRHQQELYQADLDFENENLKRWMDSIQSSFGSHPPRSIIWDDIGGVLEVIQHFMGENLNHTMLPDGGGLDMRDVRLYHQDNILNFIPENRMSYLIRFGNAQFEYLRESPVDSFFLIEGDALEKTGVYEEVSGQYEELVEINEGHYEERSVWDSGYYFNSNKGKEESLPREARLVQRYLRGNFLIVAKSSLWNRTNSTYDGRHNKMNALQIRQIIERAIRDGARENA